MMFISLVALVFGRCAWLDKSEHIAIVENYEVGWSDLEANRSILRRSTRCSGCYDVIVEGYIFAVGHNELFIIAKQQPNFDTAVTGYYLVDIRKNVNDRTAGVEGPLDKNSFDRLVRNNDISDLKFDLEFDRIPK